MWPSFRSEKQHDILCVQFKCALRDRDAMDDCVHSHMVCFHSNEEEMCLVVCISNDWNRAKFFKKNQSLFFFSQN